MTIEKDEGNLRAADIDSPAAGRSRSRSRSSTVRDSGRVRGNSSIPTASRSPTSLLLSAHRRDSFASTRQDNLQHYLSSPASLSKIVSPVYNRSGITLFPQGSKNWTPDSQMKVALSPRGRVYSRREQSEQQQEQQKLLHRTLTFPTYAATTGAVTTVSTSGGGVGQPLESKITDDSGNADENGGTGIPSSPAILSGGSVKGLDYGAVEDGGYSGGREIEELSSIGGDSVAKKEESQDGAAMDCAVQTYMSVRCMSYDGVLNYYLI